MATVPITNCYGDKVMKQNTCVMMSMMIAGSAWALQLLHTAEGDSAEATDLLLGDGAQNGAFTHTWSNNTRSATSDVFVTPLAANSKFGTSAFFFNKTATYLNTIDLQGASELGSAFTLAAYVRPLAAPSLIRLFSTYNGIGGTAGQLLFDYGTQVSGLRLLVNGTGITPSPAVTVSANVYTHLAATYDNGAVKLYVNGTQVGSGTAGSGAPVIDNSDGRRIQVGEDWLWGSAGNQEQHNGYMDDILIYDRALTSNEIGRLTVASAAEVFLQDGVLYTAEGDTAKATDGLDRSLRQNGSFLSAGVSVSDADAKFGTQAFRFENAVSGSDALLLPDTKLLGQRFTLAAQVKSATNIIQRLFSNYAGGSVGTDAFILDFDPDRSSGWSIRCYHAGVQTYGQKTFYDGAYHHLAVTYDNGAVTLYVDAERVGGGTNGSGAVTLVRDLQVGEDSATGADEQLAGFVDDILFYTNALPVGALRQVAYCGAAAYFAGDLSRPGILYSAEGDTSAARDKLTGDGEQNGVFASGGVTVSAANPKFGRRAYAFANTVSNEVHDVIRLPGSKSLGNRFTLAAYVDTTSLTSFQRLFSSYTGGGAVTAAQLLFDFDPDNIVNPAMRLYCNGAATTSIVPFNDGAYHHLAATYDNGEVRLYLDGTQVGIGTNGTGAVTMTYDLQLGEDVGAFGADEQLRGDADDVVVLFEALSPADIVALKTVGAREFFGLPPLWPKGTLFSIQ